MGRHTDLELRHEAEELRFKGLTYRAIGDQLEVSRQRVQQLLRPPREIYNAVRFRAGSKCERCAVVISNGHVHHIEETLAHPAYNSMENLKYLCVSCHSKEPWPNQPEIREPIPSGACCSHCGYELSKQDIAAALGSVTSPLKAATARENGKLGGRPLGSKNKPRGS